MLVAGERLDNGEAILRMRLGSGAGEECEIDTIETERAGVVTSELAMDESGGSGSSPCSAEKRFEVGIFFAGLSGLKPLGKLDRS